MKEFIFKGKVKDLKKAMKLFELIRCKRYGIEKGIDTSYIDYKIKELKKGDKLMKKVLELFVIIFILGLISGIIPALGMALLFKFPILIVPVFILTYCWFMYEWIKEN